ncbi:hypothetical protein [Adhaeribacter pallidiroseus]|uniref:Uncharacterized protein n=1 Tax=Adhaeribacter pallidiroseus TaxID=2072847 RepID=A0A369QKA8_9BACT|nr:hypothetical protein [Adhaeribacter pallidiroseus]RDC63289.1 hypothetical protein AHMF7616_01891 [Adhaeribacter pallidiroseus]
MSALKDNLEQEYTYVFADNEEGLINEKALRDFVDDANETFLAKDELPEFEYLPVDSSNTTGFWKGLLATGKTTFGLALDRVAQAKASLTGALFTGMIKIRLATSSIDQPHFQLWNDTITGKVNQEQRAEIYLRNTGDLEFRNVTGERFVWRSGDFVRELAYLDGGGNLVVAGSITVNGVLLGTPAPPIPKGVEWKVKPSTPVIAGNILSIGQATYAVNEVEKTAAAVSEPILLPATGKKQVCSIAVNLTSNIWSIIFGEPVDDDKNYIFPVVGENFLHLTYIELSSIQAVVYNNDPFKLLSAPSDSTKDGLTAGAIKQYYLLKTDLPAAPNLAPYALKNDLNPLATSIAGVDAKAEAAIAKNTTQDTQLTSLGTRATTLESDVALLKTINDYTSYRDLGTSTLPSIDGSYYTTKRASAVGVATDLGSGASVLNNIRIGPSLRLILDSKNLTDTLTGFLATNGTLNVTLNGLTYQAVIVDQTGFTFIPGVRHDVEISMIEAKRFEVFINPKL